MVVINLINCKLFKECVDVKENKQYKIKIYFKFTADEVSFVLALKKFGPTCNTKTNKTSSV